jgi:ApbE superfamily uncharacterized protein (UPF0280 family)
MNEIYRERTYRRGASAEGLVSFSVTECESDLHISAVVDLRKEARRALKKARAMITRYGAAHPPFIESLSPLPQDENAPPLIREMLEAAVKAGAGPMAAVAGAVAEYVGRALLPLSPELIIENGGDIFMASTEPRNVMIFTDNPHFKDRVCVRIRREQFPLGICTSSGTLGHSLSFGNADAATVLSPSAALADAAATALGNVVQSEEDVHAALERIRDLEGVTGALIVIGRKIGAWGAVELAEM